MLEITLRAGWIACTLSLAVLLLRQVHLNTVRRYPALVAYLAASIAVSTAMLWMPTHSDMYRWSYMLSRPMLALLQLGIGVSFYSDIWEWYPDAVNEKRHLRAYSAIISCVVCLLLFPLELLEVDWSKSGPVQATFFFYRYTTSVLAVFLLLSWALLRRRVMVHLRPNVRRNVAAGAAYFVLQSVACFLYNAVRYRQPEVDIIGAAQLWLATALLLWWARGLSASGEKWPEIPPLTPDELDLLEQKRDLWTTLIELGEAARLR